MLWCLFNITVCCDDQVTLWQVVLELTAWRSSASAPCRTQYSICAGWHQTKALSSTRSACLASALGNRQQGLTSPPPASGLTNAWYVCSCGQIKGKFSRALSVHTVAKSCGFLLTGLSKSLLCFCMCCLTHATQRHVSVQCNTEFCQDHGA